MGGFNLFGIIGTASNDGLADTWVNSHVNAAAFKGSLADLSELKSQNCNDCAAYVHGRSPTTSKATAYGICQGKVNNKYQSIAAVLQAEQKAITDSENAAAKAASDAYTNSFNMQAVTGMSSKTVGIFVMVIILIIIMYVLFK